MTEHTAVHKVYNVVFDIYILYIYNELITTIYFEQLYTLSVLKLVMWVLLSDKTLSDPVQHCIQPHFL